MISAVGVVSLVNSGEGVSGDTIISEVLASGGAVSLTMRLTPEYLGSSTKGSLILVMANSLLPGNLFLRPVPREAMTFPSLHGVETRSGTERSTVLEVLLWLLVLLSATWLLVLRTSLQAEFSFSSSTLKLFPRPLTLRDSFEEDALEVPDPCPLMAKRSWLQVNFSFLPPALKFFACSFTLLDSFEEDALDVADFCSLEAIRSRCLARLLEVG